jgi:hypothetical protein
MSIVEQMIVRVIFDSESSILRALDDMRFFPRSFNAQTVRAGAS